MNPFAFHRMSSSANSRKWIASVINTATSLRRRGHLGLYCITSTYTAMQIVPVVWSPIFLAYDGVAQNSKSGMKQIEKQQKHSTIVNVAGYMWQYS